MNQKYLIIGSGFNALATAYFLKIKNNDVKILFERSIKGVLGSVIIENENFDLGYQFFDGLDKESEKFIRNMFENEDLYDFKYGASTFSNNLFYSDHAIPYWPSYGKIFVVKAFIYYLFTFLKSFFIKDEVKVNNLSDLCKKMPPNIRYFMSRGCEKHFQIKPEELDAAASDMGTYINVRQTLFNDKVSNFLKKNSTFFDKHLASRRKTNIILDNISLYPKGKNMEFVTDKLIERLKNKGVIFEKSNFDEIKLIPSQHHLKFNEEKFDKAIITTSLGNTQRVLKINKEKSYEHYISQVFVYFAVDRVNFKFQYTQVNDAKLFCSRISNCSLYSKKTKEHNHILIAEIPLTANNKIWDDDDKLKDIAWNEIIKCGIVESGYSYSTAKVLKIEKTFPVPKTNFFSFLKEIELKLESHFYGNVSMIGQGFFTRRMFVKELLKKLS